MWPPWAGRREKQGREKQGGHIGPPLQVWLGKDRYIEFMESVQATRPFGPVAPAGAQVQMQCR